MRQHADKAAAQNEAQSKARKDLSLKNSSKIVLSVSLLVGMLAFASGQARAESDMMVQNAWSRAALAGRNGVVYFSVMDMGLADRLLSAQTPIADKAELHKSVEEHGISKMLPVSSVPLAAGSTVTFAPGGFHVMLIGLKQALKEGDTFPLTLHFEKAGDVQTTVKVGKAGGMDMKMN